MASEMGQLGDTTNYTSGAFVVLGEPGDTTNYASDDFVFLAGTNRAAIPSAAVESPGDSTNYMFESTYEFMFESTYELCSTSATPSEIDETDAREHQMVTTATPRLVEPGDSTNYMADCCRLVDSSSDSTAVPSEVDETEAREQLEIWLREARYEGVNHKRKTWSSKTISKSKYPLHTAVKRQDQIVIELLLRFGADPTLLNSSKQTPLAVAEQTNKDNSNDAIIQLLLQAQADWAGRDGSEILDSVSKVET